MISLKSNLNRFGLFTAVASVLVLLCYFIFLNSNIYSNSFDESSKNVNFSFASVSVTKSAEEDGQIAATPNDSIESETSLVEAKVEEILEEEDVEVDPFYVLLPDYEDARQQTFVEVALTASKGEKYIVLVVADEGYLHLYQNFYETSVIPLSLPTLSIALDEPSLQHISKLETPVFLDDGGVGSANPSFFGSGTFKSKTRKKLEFVVRLLRLGYDVILSDLDIVFFKDPIPFLQTFKPEIQVAVQRDWWPNHFNSGFFVARSAAVTLEAFHMMYNASIYMRDDQAAFNFITHEKKNDIGIKLSELPDNKFPCGRKYFEQPGLHWPEDVEKNTQAFMVHNNWVVGVHSKIYRFKEAGLWVCDFGGYYSNPDTKYLTYDGPQVDLETEHIAFRNALYLAKTRKRILIFPKFGCFECGQVYPGPGKECRGYFDNRKKKKQMDHCKVELCPFIAHFYLKKFEEKFRDDFREATFLQHPKVPEQVKKSVEEMISADVIAHGSSESIIKVTDLPIMDEGLKTNTRLVKDIEKHVQTCSYRQP